MTDEEKIIKEARFILGALQVHESTLMECVADPELTDEERKVFVDDLEYCSELIEIYSAELEMLTGVRSEG